MDGFSYRTSYNGGYNISPMTVILKEASLVRPNCNPHSFLLVLYDRPRVPLFI